MYHGDGCSMASSSANSPSSFPFVMLRAPRYRDHPFHAIVITHSSAS